MLTNTGVVANVASATETLLALIDPKNAIQWAAAAQPTEPPNLERSGGARRLSLSAGEPGVAEEGGEQEGAGGWGFGGHVSGVSGAVGHTTAAAIAE